MTEGIAVRHNGILVSLHQTLTPDVFGYGAAARAGVGIAWVQALSSARLATKVLDLIEGGKSPDEAGRSVQRHDHLRRNRQPMVMGFNGHYVHTGMDVPRASHYPPRRIAETDIIVAGNLLNNPDGYSNIVDAWHQRKGRTRDPVDLVLDIAAEFEEQYGDARGKTSAALIVCTSSIARVALVPCRPDGKVIEAVRDTPLRPIGSRDPNPLHPGSFWKERELEQLTCRANGDIPGALKVLQQMRAQIGKGIPHLVGGDVLYTIVKVAQQNGYLDDALDAYDELVHHHLPGWRDVLENEVFSGIDAETRARFDDIRYPQPEVTTAREPVLTLPLPRFELGGAMA